MMDGFLLVATVVVALGCGLVAGVFFAFSNFVMKALARLPAAQGIATMQSINVTVITPLFMGALFGTALACIGLIVAAIADWGEPYAPYLLAGGAVYFAGTALMTVVFHVPRNNALDELDAGDSGSVAFWNGYVRTWTAGNHVRTVAALGAATLLTIAVRVS
jgi:uncharacterized membrane protein